MTDRPQRIGIDADRVRRLLLSLDGVRYSCAIADMCHKRALRKLRTFEEHPEVGPAEAEVIEVVADVWSIIDAAHRIRMLLRQFPVVKRQEPAFVTFIKATATVEDLRHYIQHINAEVGKLSPSQPPLWGAISWASDKAPLRYATVMAASSRLRHSATGLVLDTQLLCFTQSFVLSARDINLDLDDLVSRIRVLDGVMQRWSEAIEFEGGGRYQYRPASAPMLTFQYRTGNPEPLEAPGTTGSI